MDKPGHWENAVGVLVIAAGLGQRFTEAGGTTDKLQATFTDASGQRKSVFVHSCQAAQQSGLPVCVVTRPTQRAIRDYCEQHAIPTVLVENTRMGESIAAGVRHTARWGGWLIHLADMPFISAQTLRLVASKVTAEGVVRPVFRASPGHPVGFGRCAFNALSALTDEQGARSLLMQFPLYMIELQDASILQDIDLPSQLPVAESPAIAERPRQASEPGKDPPD
ncbi:MAG TPA: molybdopterin-guanine dinucleotide biosynthesis protein MobA [Erwinia sp.]|uniref:nucleotidyltransferase family protein n=1 Tax=Erwinia citreus TaxID=558 RepID=UPI000E87522B|nr:nucleotidyltransferase family protein [Erwinia sp.]HBV40521.1 molybdopterin-guanine dinucleotide biosynthesis protein MobA [Erwinia sp.]